MRGRWYKSMGGIGLEIETGSNDPDLAWAIGGSVELDSSDYPRLTYRAMAGSGEAMGTGHGHAIGAFNSLRAAQDALVKVVGCEVIPTAPVCIECGRCLDCNECRHGDGLCVPCWWEIASRPKDEQDSDESEDYEGDSLRTLGLSEADFR